MCYMISVEENAVYEFTELVLREVLICILLWGQVHRIILGHSATGLGNTRHHVHVRNSQPKFCTSFVNSLLVLENSLLNTQHLHTWVSFYMKKEIEINAKTESVIFLTCPACKVLLRFLELHWIHRSWCQLATVAQSRIPSDPESTLRILIVLYC